MVKICVVCGKLFDADTPRFKLCFDDCRRMRKQAQMKAFRKKHPPMSYYHASTTYTKCTMCGESTGSHYAKFCTTCLLKEYKYGNRTLASARLNNRGYDSAEIKLEIEERGI